MTVDKDFWTLRRTRRPSDVPGLIYFDGSEYGAKSGRGRGSFQSEVVIRLEPDGQVCVSAATVDDDDDGVTIEDRVPPNPFLAALATASQGGEGSLTPLEKAHAETITFTRSRVDFRYFCENDRIMAGYGTSIEPGDFDPLLLDAFSVIESGEPARQSARDVQLGAVELAILDAASRDKALVRRFSPRAFEVFVG